MDINLFNYTLHLADNSLIMGHRLSEWTGHGPVLEQDIAISNIALDHIGQARNFYKYAAQLKGDGATEDTLAYLRENDDYKNIILVELPNGDWAQTIMKLFLFSSWQYFFYSKLISSSDTELSAIAEKSLKEVTYHLRWSSEWVIRLGDGTEESNRRIKNAIDELWKYTGEMFMPSEYEIDCVTKNIAVNISELKPDWDKKIEEVFNEATLKVPGEISFPVDGKNGKHTEHLQGILNDLQYLQKAYPGCEW